MKVTTGMIIYERLIITTSRHQVFSKKKSKNTMCVQYYEQTEVKIEFQYNLIFAFGR